MQASNDVQNVGVARYVRENEESQHRHRVGVLEEVDQQRERITVLAPPEWVNPAVNE